MTTIIFKPEFESKLKRLRIKTKFVKNVKEDVKEHEYNLNRIIENLNSKKDWIDFISYAFQWSSTPEGCIYWRDIVKLD